MRYLPYRRQSLPWLALAVALCPLSPLFAQRNVETLRLALRSPVREAPEFRKKVLDEKVAAIKSIGDIAKALQLQEWRDEDRDVQIANVDGAIRAQLAKRFEDSLIKILQKDDADSRIAAADMLAEIGASLRGVPPNRCGEARLLAPALAANADHPDPRVRAAVARALGKINPDPDVAVPALAAIFKSAEVEPRREAATALGNMMQTTAQINKGKSVTGIEATRGEVIKTASLVAGAAGAPLGDRDARVRRAGAEAIQQAAMATTELVGEPRNRSEFPPEGRELTKEELAEIEQYSRDVAEERKELDPAVLAIRGQLAALSGTLQDPVVGVRLNALKAFEEIALARWRMLRRQDSIPNVNRKEADLGELNWDWVLVAAEADEKVDDKDPLREGLLSALPNLGKNLSDQDVRVRLAAIDVLEVLQSESAPVVPELIAALNDENRFVRWGAARTLGRIGVAKAGNAVPSLAELLTDPDLAVRQAVCSVLQKFGSGAKEAVPALIRAVQVGDADTKIAAINTLEAIGPPALGSIDTLITALQDEDHRVRAESAEALGGFGTKARAAEAALFRATKDNDPDVRKAASEAYLSVRGE